MPSALGSSLALQHDPARDKYQNITSLSVHGDIHLLDDEKKKKNALGHTWVTQKCSTAQLEYSDVLLNI